MKSREIDGKQKPTRAAVLLGDVGDGKKGKGEKKPACRPWRKENQYLDAGKEAGLLLSPPSSGR